MSKYVNYFTFGLLIVATIYFSWNVKKYSYLQYRPDRNNLDVGLSPSSWSRKRTGKEVEQPYSEVTGSTDEVSSSVKIIVEIVKKYLTLDYTGKSYDPSPYRNN